MNYKIACPKCKRTHDVNKRITGACDGAFVPRATLVCQCGEHLEVVPGRYWKWRWPNVTVREKKR